MDLHYELTGPANAPVVVFSNSLGADLSMWDMQAPELSRHFRVLRYDTRGHGKSSLPAAPHDVASLGGDLLGLLDSLSLSQVSFCGLSLGAMTGMWLALHAPQRLRKLILCSGAAKIGTQETWNTRIELVNHSGMQAVVPGILERWFTADFRMRSPEAVKATQVMLERASVSGYIAGCAAVRDTDLRQILHEIAVPTLVVNGASDPVTPPADGKFLAERIPAARYTELAGAHLFNVESSHEFTREILQFLASV